MSERTCEIDGQIFEGVPHSGAADSLCEGCVGDDNPDMCYELGFECLHSSIIWIAAA